MLRYDNARPTLTFSPDGNILAVRGHRSVWLWDVTARQMLATLPGAKRINALAFAPDSRTLATAGADGVVRLHRVAGGELLTSFDWQIGRVRAVAFAPDGLTAAAAGDESVIVIWDVDG